MLAVLLVTPPGGEQLSLGLKGEPPAGNGFWEESELRVAVFSPPFSNLGPPEQAVREIAAVLSASFRKMDRFTGYITCLLRRMTEEASANSPGTVRYFLSAHFH
jgi:hypothetical protein